MIEGSGIGAKSGSVPLTNGSGSGFWRSKNKRIRIRNTTKYIIFLSRRGSVHGSRGDLSDEEVRGRHHVRRHREEGACQDLQRHQSKKFDFFL
jgi:hypothetical protein